MNSSLKDYLWGYLKRHHINPKGIAFDKVTDFDSMVRQLEICKIDSSDIRQDLRVIFYLHEKGIILNNSDYKAHPQYLLIKDTMKYSTPFSTENYIEHYLLDKETKDAIYEGMSIYSMGHPPALIGKKYEYTALSIEIMERIKFYQKALKKATLNIEGMIDRLRDSKFNFDIESFNEEKYKSQKCKILYLFYELEYKLIPEFLNKEKKLQEIMNKEISAKNKKKKTKNNNKKKKRKNDKIKERHYFDVIAFLSNPSIESVDYSHLGLESYGVQTYNGKIIRLIKNMIEKELLEEEITTIVNAINQISLAWDKPFQDASAVMNLDIEPYYDQLICTFNSIFHKPMEHNPKQTSPIEMLYLKVVLHEYLGQIEDIFQINRYEQETKNNTVPSVSSGVVWFMKQLYDTKVDLFDVKEYIDHYKRIQEIAQLVYSNESPDKDDRRKLRDNIDTVILVLGYCARARSPVIKISEIPVALIISCFQTIFTYEEYDYSFSGFEDRTGKHRKPSVRDTLKSDKRSADALKIYLAYETADRLYHNMGISALRDKRREFEIRRAEILKRIYSCPSVSDMLSVHECYYEKIKPSLLCYT